jgi:drug/metabolite transporter (DMT)-like permease
MHVAALSRAPLSLVQAFVAGGLALAAPMAAIGLRHRLEPGERTAIGLMVVALVLLAVGLGGEGRHADFAPAGLAVYLGALAVLAAVVAGTVHDRRRPAALGLAGGILYGAADLAIKALTGLSGSVLTSPWLLVAALTTLAAFFAFQRALQAGRPLTVIALMTAATNATSIAGGFVVFGDPLGRTPVLAAAHALAFVLVGVAAWHLAPSQSRLAAA